MTEQHEPEIDVVVSGHLCVDLLPQMVGVPVDALPTPGRFFEVGPLVISTGGAVSNTGQSLHQLGVNVCLMGTVGDDMLGGVIISVLEARDPALSRHIRVRRGQSSSYTVVLSPEKVDRIFLHNGGTNDTFGLQDIDFDTIARARIFHLGYPIMLPELTRQNGEALEELYRRAKATGVVTSMDTAMPDPDGASGQVDWPLILSRALPFVDIFVPSINEIMFMLRREDFMAWQHDLLPHLSAGYLAGLAEELIGLGAVITGFKLGEMGIYLHTTADRAAYDRLARLNLQASTWAGQQVWHPSFQVEVVGTTGAGDSAYAGLLAAMLRDYAPAEAVRMACAVGACNVEAADATSGVRTWDETQARIAAGWPVSALRLPGI